MLLTKTVKVKWQRKTKKWYISKGYIFTKYGDEFEIKVEDLLPYNDTSVLIKCDGEWCEKSDPKYITWACYIHCVKEDGRYYCNECAKRLTGYEKSRIARLKNGKSFEQWCVENNRQDVLDRWDYELNEYKPNEVSHSTYKQIFLKCPRGIHEGELKNIKYFTRFGKNESISCKLCNSFAQWGIDNLGEDFLDKYWDYQKNQVNPWKIDKCSTVKVWIKCINKDYHGSYIVFCSDFFNGNRCPYCGSIKVHYKESLGYLYPQVLTLWSDKNKQSPFFYLPNSNKKIWFKCNSGHDDYERSVSHQTKLDFRCPKCVRERNESFLQEKIRLYLESTNYTILHEHNCSIVPKNPKTKKPLPFDNEVKELKLIIEVMGIQHYEVTGFNKKHAKLRNTTPEYELHMQQVRDRYKRIYAKSKGYKYIEIPYWTDDKNETWKQLIDEILTNKIPTSEVINN